MIRRVLGWFSHATTEARSLQQGEIRQRSQALRQRSVQMVGTEVSAGRTGERTQQAGSNEENGNGSQIKSFTELRLEDGTGTRRCNGSCTQHRFRMPTVDRIVLSRQPVGSLALWSKGLRGGNFLTPRRRESLSRRLQCNNQSQLCGTFDHMEFKELRLGNMSGSAPVI